MSNAIEAYRNAGVDLELGNDVSRMLYEASKHTWNDRAGRLGEVREYGVGFSSFRAMPLTHIGRPDLLHSLAADGVGTKVEAAERMEDHRTIGFDLIAMACDDAVIRGAEPYSVATVLDVRALRGIPRLPELIGHLAAGYVDAAKAADVTIVDGETAELNDRVAGYGEFNYNWSATALWMAHEDRVIDETKIRPGDQIVALKEHGFRSNGLSLIRKAFGSLDKAWHELPLDSPDAEQDRGKSLGELVLRPSIPYSRLVVDMTGGYDMRRNPKAEIHGSAHVTGGGIPEKLGRALRNTGYGAVLDNLYDPPEVMRFAQQTARSIGGFDDEAAYRTLNMGQGMLIITPDADKVMAVAEDSRVVGEIVEKKGISLLSKGLETRRWLSFEAE